MAAHGEVDDVTLLVDASGRGTGAALVRMRHRGAASRLVRVCTSNFLIMGGCAVPVRVAHAPGALDDDAAAPGVWAAPAPLPGGAAAAGGEAVDVDGGGSGDVLEPWELLSG